ncbi:leucine-rich repeat protein lrrA-like isoform X2 [Stegodyphus dumicola]|nr:leucine-rich repeat protein lrrA-like isoform X2 [Stegodyphus dumicola]XP_035233838.1 leucine-rich repeat protein lrrA-like isoform X2 [Stegodyphus dumicola]
MNDTYVHNRLTMNDTYIDYSSQELDEIPETVLKLTEIQKLFLNYNNLTRVPSLLCKNLLSLSCLSLNGNMLEHLPDEIGCLSHLCELYIKENNLLKLPESISNLQKLQKLCLTGNQILELPESLSSLVNLTELTADENALENLPHNFGNLCSLTYLDVSGNAISSLPESFGKLNCLKVLNLSDNCLCCLPESFQDLSKLEVIDLTNNKISRLPEKLEAAKCIKTIYITNNCVDSLPPWFSEMENIKKLFLGSNNLQQMPFDEKFCDTCKLLERLDLSGNNVSHLPYNFGQLKNLKFLDMGSPLDELERNRFLKNGNDLIRLPSSFCNLCNLTKLELDENELVELPTNFGCLSNMRYLNLCHNALRILPKSFCQLQKLKVCLLSMNNLSYLPDDFGKLIELQELRLDNNLLMELPESFNNLTSLLVLDLYKNKLKIIPTAVNNMKYIKHMDLRENDFGVEFNKMPEVIRKCAYVERDLTLQHTWRGRKREDIQPESWVKNRVVEDYSALLSDVEISALNPAPFLRRGHHQENVKKDYNSSSYVPVAENKSHENVPDNNICNGYCDEKCKSLSESDNDPINYQKNVSDNIICNGYHEEKSQSLSESGDDPINCESASCSTIGTKSDVLNEGGKGYWDDETVLSDLSYCNEEECDSLRINQSEECWDDEISETVLPEPLKSSESNKVDQDATQFEDAFSDPSSVLDDWDIDYVFGFSRSSREIYKHPIKDTEDSAFKVFLPSDLHAPRMNKSEIWCPVEEGQFDDCDL